MRYQTNGFSVETPDDWEDRSIITFVAPSVTGEFATNLVITREAVDISTSIEDYAYRQFDIAQQEVAGLQIVSQENTTVGGKPAVEIIQRLAAHGINLQQLQTFILLPEEVCVITCTATVGNFNQWLPRFRKILDGFQVKT
ncbi:MAG: DUF1795 domain-containing protein [Acidobacteriota bacterium]|nr:DUF1795 domain-containing protein [Acidobacteriota bacterium]